MVKIAIRTLVTTLNTLNEMCTIYLLEGFHGARATRRTRAAIFQRAQELFRFVGFWEKRVLKGWGAT